MLDIFFVQLCLVVGVCLYLCLFFVVIVQIHFRTMTVNQYLNLLIVQYFSITADLYFSFFPVFEYWKKNGHGFIFIFIYINLNCTFKQRPWIWFFFSSLDVGFYSISFFKKILYHFFWWAHFNHFLCTTALFHNSQGSNIFAWFAERSHIYIHPSFYLHYYYVFNARNSRAQNEFWLFNLWPHTKKALLQKQD